MGCECGPLYKPGGVGFFCLSGHIFYFFNRVIFGDLTRLQISKTKAEILTFATNPGDESIRISAGDPGQLLVFVYHRSNNINMCCVLKTTEVMSVNFKHAVSEYSRAVLHELKSVTHTVLTEQELSFVGFLATNDSPGMQRS